MTTDKVQHTPGPWKLDTDEARIWGEERLLASVHYRTVFAEHRAQDQANARLIAAAPDLLAACKQAVTLAGTAHRRAQMIADLKAAIAKAEGRS